jgi:hypothetical protein
LSFAAWLPGRPRLVIPDAKVDPPQGWLENNTHDARDMRVRAIETIT